MTLNHAPLLSQNMYVLDGTSLKPRKCSAHIWTLTRCEKFNQKSLDVSKNVIEAEKAQSTKLEVLGASMTFSMISALKIHEDNWISN